MIVNLGDPPHKGRIGEMLELLSDEGGCDYNLMDLIDLNEE